MDAVPIRPGESHATCPDGYGRGSLDHALRVSRTSNFLNRGGDGLLRGSSKAPWPKERNRVLAKVLFLDERALAFAQRLGRLFGRNAAENLVVVPFCLGFARRLNLDEIHVVHHAAILTHPPFGEEIVDRQLPYFVCGFFTV